ncbi:hypothetical protein VTN77DRAFT_8189 [Rasamsonia byssochlamydoides]|uniref:uncharacterized protein n=1 Tax=Rasamsonia byssochlamydoides TaxID=89139 RepID=UPI003743462B
MLPLRVLRTISRPTFSSPSFGLSRLSAPARSFSAAAVKMVTTVSQEIKKNHRELEGYYNAIIKSDDPDERMRFQNQFTWELARHTVSEELIVYPAFEKYLKDGVAMAEKDRSQHQVIKEKLKTFQDLRESDPSFEPTLTSLMDDFSEHIKQEEEVDLVKLEDMLAKSESQALARQFDRTKMFVPSRSHPSAPTKPPFETAFGLMTAPIDRLSDMFRKFPGEYITSSPSPQANLGD